MLKKLLSKSEFTKNTFVLVIGTIVAQSIPLMLHPYLRRIYAAEDFGAMAIYLNIFSALTIISSLRYEATIVLPKHNKIAANLLSLAFFINISFCFLLFIALLFFKNNLVNLLNFPKQYANYLYFLPLTTAAFGIYQSINFWLIRQKAFKASTTNKIVRRVVEGAGHTILGSIKYTGGLFIGDLLGNVANVISGVRQAVKNNFSLKMVSVKKMKYAFKKYIEYPKYNVLPTLLSTAATILPFLFINKFYSTEIVGYLDLSRLVLSIPLIFISATISQVFFQQTTQKKHENKSIKNDIKNILYLLLAVIVVEIIVVQLAGPFLFSFVFGAKYEISGFYSQILVFSFALNFIGSTFSSIFITFEKIKINSLWQVAYFCVICCLFFFKHLTIFDFIKVFVAAEIIMHVSYLLLIYLIVNQYETAILKK